LEWPIKGVLSVVLNWYSYTLHFPGLIVKNLVYLSSTSISFSFCCFSHMLLLMINFSKSASDTCRGSFKSPPVSRRSIHSLYFRTLP
jgi:hypothetical protein